MPRSIATARSAALLILAGLLWTIQPPLGARAEVGAAPSTSEPGAHPVRQDVGPQVHRAAAAVTGARVAQAPAAQQELYADDVVRDVSLRFERDDWLEQLGCAPGGRRPGPGRGGSEISRQDIPAQLVVDGESIGTIGVRCKGNSSLSIGNTKKPLNLTIDSFVDGQRLWGYDIVNLNNNWSDPSQLREAVALRLLGEYMPVPRFGFARVTAQDQLLGFYTMVEQVEGTWADHWFPDDRGTLIRGDSPERIAFDTSALTWEGEDLGPYRRGYEVKGIGDEDDDDGEDELIALREMIRALDAPETEGGLSDADLPDGIRRHLDVDTALWYVAGSNLIANFDSYYVGKNYYLYLSDRSERFHMISWDLGLSFGLFNAMIGGAPGPGGPGGAGGGPSDPAEADPFIQVDRENRPLLRRLLNVPGYRADYLAHYRTLFHHVFTPDWIEEVGGSYQDVIRDAVGEEVGAQGNVSGMFTFEQFEANLRGPIMGPGLGPGPPQERPGIKTLVQSRREHLAGAPWLQPVDVGVLDVALTPVLPRASEPVMVDVELDGAATIADVELRYRVGAAGAERRVPMRALGEARWRAEVPGQGPGREVRFAVRIALPDGRVAFRPEANLTEPYTYTVAPVNLPDGEPGPLVINELMALNKATITDEAGEFDDWLELYNGGSRPVSLEGLHLSDDPDDPWRMPLPAVMLAPGDHLLVWCDNDPDQGSLHAPFRLDREGEAVVLASRDSILDSVAFGEQAADVSYGRSADGAEDWNVCGRPTPGGPNRCAVEGDGRGLVFLPVASR